MGTIGLVASLCLVTTSCGGAADSLTAALDEPTTASAPEFDCAGAPRANLALSADAQLCADTGFEPSTHGFSFPNWGEEGSFDATNMLAMFGPDAVCATLTETSCTLFPAAEQWMQQVNQAMTGGHCEGMATLSQRLHDGIEAPAQLQPGVASAYELQRDVPPVTRQIDYWWATQLTDEVAMPTVEMRGLAPTEVLGHLVDGIKSMGGYTLGMFSGDSGHAVTPIAVSKEGEDYVIAIYDNNVPGAIGYIVLDPATESWVYDDGSDEPWEGTGPGTLDLTAMSWRAGPFSAPFADPGTGGDGKGSAERVVLVTGDVRGNDSVGARFTVDGKEYDTAVDTVFPESVVVTRIIGQGVKGVQLLIDQSASDVIVEPTVTVPTEVRVSSDSYGSARVTAVGQARGTRAGFRVTTGASGRSTVATDAGASAAVNVANGRRALNVRMKSGSELQVTPAENGDADVELDEGDGAVAFTLEDETESGEVIDMVAEVDGDEFAVEEEVVEADEIDADYLAEADWAGSDWDAADWADDNSDAPSGTADSDTQDLDTGSSNTQDGGNEADQDPGNETDSAGNGTDQGAGGQEDSADQGDSGSNDSGPAADGGDSGPDDAWEDNSGAGDTAGGDAGADDSAAAPSDE